MATVVHSQYGRLNHAAEEGQVELLDAWAKKLGYRLVKESRRKSDAQDRKWSRSRKTEADG